MLVYVCTIETAIRGSVNLESTIQTILAGKSTTIKNIAFKKVILISNTLNLLHHNNYEMVISISGVCYSINTSVVHINSTYRILI